MMATMSDMSIDRWVEFVVFMLLLGACGRAVVFRGVDSQLADLGGYRASGRAAGLDVAGGPE